MIRARTKSPWRINKNRIKENKNRTILEVSNKSTAYHRNILTYLWGLHKHLLRKIRLNNSPLSLPQERNSNEYQIINSWRKSKAIIWMSIFYLYLWSYVCPRKVIQFYPVRTRVGWKQLTGTSLYPDICVKGPCF